MRLVALDGGLEAVGEFAGAEQDAYVRPYGRIRADRRRGRSVRQSVNWIYRALESP